MAVLRKPTVPNPQAVTVSPSAGEFLRFKLEAEGPVPIFSFASSIKGVLFEASDFYGHPLVSYEWDHLKNPTDTQRLELLNLGLAFFTSSSHRFVVELHKPGAAAQTVLDIVYTGQAVDTFQENLAVVIP
jgi:hypothetical protein